MENNDQNIQKNEADIKPCVSALKRARNSMQTVRSVPSTSYVSDEQNPLSNPFMVMTDFTADSFPMSFHGDYYEYPFGGSVAPRTSDFGDTNEILLRMDRCDINENEIPGLFKYMEKYLPGFRFVPTDEQLVTHYLRKKIDNVHVPRCLIRDVNLYKHHPRELAEAYPRHDSNVDEWYFYTPRDRKYPNGQRPKRAAGNGYWKATGADKPVIVNEQTVGFRQALVFYEGKPPKGDKTSWIMHEYKVVEKRERNSKSDMRLDDWVLCRIYYKKVEKAQKKEEEGSGSNSAQTNEDEEIIKDDDIMQDPHLIFPNVSIDWDHEPLRDIWPDIEGAEFDIPELEEEEEEEEEEEQ